MEKKTQAHEKVEHEKNVWRTTGIIMFCGAGGLICGSINSIIKGDIGVGIYLGSLSYACGYLGRKSHNRYEYIKNNYEKCINDYIKKDKISYYKE